MQIRDTGRGPRLRRALAGGMLVLAVLAGCHQNSGQVDAARAADIARAYFDAGQAPGTTVLDITVATPVDVGQAWRIQIDAHLGNTAHPASPPGPVHLLIDVDKDSGEAKIIGQG